MKVVELFSGTECLSNAFRRKGHDCFTIDWDEQFPSSLHCDISQLKVSDLPKDFQTPDIVFVGTDCTTYSIAAISHHREKDPVSGELLPKSDKAKFADAMNIHVKELIKELDPKLQIWENPVGGMRKMWFMKDLIRTTTTYCFQGDTEIITDQGFFKLRDLDGKSVRALNINGEFEEGRVYNYGIQPLYHITLSRARALKHIYATKDHQWLATNQRGPRAKYTTYTTEQLTKGLYLPYAQQKKKVFRLNNRDIARGFVFGDGWLVKKEPNTGAHIQFVNEKLEMLPYFEGVGGKRWWDNTPTCKILKACSLPSYWKTDIPSINESADVRASWLAGYIAADGSVSRNNGQITLSCKSETILKKVKELTESLGIQTLTINAYLRKGYGKVATYLYQLTFCRKEFPLDLLLREKHRESFLLQKEPKFAPRRWSVVSVEKTDKIESVYCCEMPKTHTFTLVDGIVTHNCQYGATYRKATDFFSNIYLPLKPPCKNGDPCHEAAPRGSKTGSQGLKNAVERAMYPAELCDHIVQICEDYVNGKNI